MQIFTSLVQCFPCSVCAHLLTSAYRCRYWCSQTHFHSLSFPLMLLYVLAVLKVCFCLYSRYISNCDYFFLNIIPSRVPSLGLSGYHYSQVFCSCLFCLPLPVGFPVSPTILSMQFLSIIFAVFLQMAWVFFLICTSQTSQKCRYLRILKSVDYLTLNV